MGVVYRPNEAKIKNLKAKDYLGKARLVAASDRSNAFTGFQGSEMKKAMALETTAKDDRPAETISYAATNLVQRNLTSRSRQQSEPPIGRNTFPPTPPPDSGKPSSMSGSSGLTHRAASVRSGRPPQLDLERPGAGTNGRTGGELPSMGKSRIGTTRTASEPRGPPSRQYQGRARDGGRPRLYRETTGSQRGMNDHGFDGVAEDELADEVYDLYASPRSNGTGRTRQRRYVDEEAEYASEYEDDIVDDGDFEMMGGPPAAVRGSSRTRRRGTSRSREIRKFRVKVHAQDDTRYIMIGPAVEFGDFEGKIREKFGFQSRLRIRMRDDGDQITMGDQDDLELLIGVAKDEARRENQDMGKMEVRLSIVMLMLGTNCIIDMGRGETLDIRDDVTITFGHCHAFCCCYLSVGVGQTDMLSNLPSRYPNMTRTLRNAVISPLAINFILDDVPALQ